MGRTALQIVEEQIRNWRHQNRDRRRIKMSAYPVMTISREFGARGAALAHTLAERIGFKVWDQELLLAIAEQLGSDEEQLKTIDERRRSMLEDNLLGLMKNANTHVNYMLALNRVVKSIEEVGSGIVVGRGARYICRDKGAFHLRVVAPLSARVTEYARREQIPPDEALTVIKRKDRERAEFVELGFNRDISASSDYDLILNSERFSLQQMADIVIPAYEIATGRRLTAVARG